MLAFILKKHFPKLIYNSLLWLSALVSVLIIACNNKHSETMEYSKGFIPLFDSTNNLLELNKPDLALRYLDSKVGHVKNLNTADKFRIYGFHVLANSKIKKPQIAVLYADSMLAILHKTSNPQTFMPFFAEANFARGDALFDLGRYNEAYNNYYQGYLIGENNLDNCTLSDYRYRMGMISYKQGNFSYAVSYFKQSFALCQSCKEDFVSFFRQQEVLDNIALSYKHDNKPDSALIYFNEALKYLDDHQANYKNRSSMFEVARAVIYGNKAEVLIGQGQFAQAAELLKKSIATNLKKGNDNQDAELSEIKLGIIYRDMHKDAQLLNLLNGMRLQFDTVKNSDAEANWNMLMAGYFKKNKDFARALPYMETFHRIKDSLAERNHVLKENDINEQVASFEKQYQIIDLKNRQRIYLFAWLIFIAMTSIIIMLIYRNWKRSRNEIGVISALNQQVNLQKADLEKTLVDLENSSQEKDRILRTVAHDLRNPLGGIASLTSVMVHDTDYNNDQIELLRIIKDTAHDSLELINEILEATSSTTAELQKQYVDINALLNTSVELMRFKAAEKNQKIMLNTLEAPEELLISREKIWRVMSNLISNAIKFSPVGAVIRVSITDEGNDVQISVNDQGIGIPDDIKNKVFNIFTDATRPGTLGEKSFGLGLSICRQIIEKHHGKIWFESNSEMGTTFYVRLSKPAAIIKPGVKATV
jgi:signal transduction histidine kinase